MHDVTDERGVPISGGIPPIVRIAAAIGILIIISVGGMVIGASKFGHVWPASNAQNIPL